MSLYNQRQSQKQSQSDSSSDGSDYEPDKKLKTTPDAGFIGELRTVFGNENQYSQSIGVAFTDVEIEDGVLYKHTQKDEYKLFSWEQVIGAHPAEYDRDVLADEPNQYMTVNYGVTSVKYEFVGSRIAAVPALEPRTDDDGNFLDADGAIVDEENAALVESGDTLCDEDEAGEWEIGNVIMWLDGNDTPSPTSKTMAKLLTKQGSDIVVPEEEAESKYGSNPNYRNEDGEFQWVKCWLTDTSNENIARDDLVGRRLRFYKEVRDSDQSDNSFHHPIVEDAKTGKQVRVQSAGGDSDSSSSGSDESSTKTETSSTGSENPEPIQDYLDTVGAMEADEVLARSLLTDMIEEPDNNLTNNMVADYGGEQALIEAVTGIPQ